MRFVYFTKLIQPRELSAYVKFAKAVGLDGFDLAVRPGYPVNPENVKEKLPEAAKQFKDAGLIIGLVSTPTNMVDPESKVTQRLFEACGKAGVPAIKIGYFRYRGNIDEELKSAHKQLAGFAKLAKETGVKACYHTHSGPYLGANCGMLRLMLQDLDPHHIGVFADTGHLAVNGSPITLELDLIRPWLHLMAIKDMKWEQTKSGFRRYVVPANHGIVQWNEVAKALKKMKFNGTVSLHGEYHVKDAEERIELGQKELKFLKRTLASE